MGTGRKEKRERVKNMEESGDWHFKFWVDKEEKSVIMYLFNKYIKYNLEGEKRGDHYQQQCQQTDL